MGDLKEAVKSGMSEMELFPIAEAFLIQSKDEPTLWQIVSIWYSWADLSETQSKGSLPGEVMFALVGAKPITSTFDVIAHVKKSLEDDNATTEDVRPFPASYQRQNE